MQKSLIFSLLLALALCLTFSTQAVFAQSDDLDEPNVDVQLDEEGDLARGPGEEGAGSSNAGESQGESGGRPPMSPEETEAVSLYYEQYISILDKTIHLTVSLFSPLLSSHLNSCQK
jgi:hypothetical protein